MITAHAWNDRILEIIFFAAEASRKLRSMGEIGFVIPYYSLVAASSPARLRALVGCCWGLLYVQPKCKFYFR